MYDNEHFEHLETLDKWELENDRQDIRGRPLVTETGERLGMIEHLLVDRDNERVAAVRLSDGRAFPVEPLDIRDDTVILMEDGRAARSDRSTGEEERIPLVEEKLVVGKREVETGGIRVRSRIVEEPVSEQVTLRDEHVEVERRPVDRRVGDADGLFQERTVEMTETDEEAVVGKEARVREELVVRKDVDQHVEQISDTVRRTEVDVDEYDGSQRDSRR